MELKEKQTSAKVYKAFIYVALITLAVTIVVAGHLTDMSPLSTTGAVFIGGAPDTVDRKPLYRGMIIWGLSMSVFGAVLCWLLYGIIGIL